MHGVLTQYGLPMNMEFGCIAVMPPHNVMGCMPGVHASLSRRVLLQDLQRNVLQCLGVGGRKHNLRGRTIVIRLLPPAATHCDLHCLHQ